MRTFTSLATFRETFIRETLTSRCGICGAKREELRPALATLATGATLAIVACAKHKAGCKREGIKVTRIIRKGVKVVPDASGKYLTIPVIA